MLTTKQKAEVNLSIMGYFKSNKWDDVCGVFAEEHPAAVIPAKDEKKYMQNLERKWRSIIRLNAKIAQLEEENEKLQDELDSFKSGTKVNTSEALPKKVLHTMEAHREQVRCVRFYPKPDKPLLASASEDGLIIIWNFTAGKLVKQIRGHKKPVEWCEWSPDGKVLATCGEDAFIMLWNTETWERIGRHIAAHDHTVSCIQFNKRGDHFYSVSRDKTIKKWKLENRKQIKIYNEDMKTGHTDWIKKIAFSPTGKEFATCGLDQTITTWDEATGEVKWTFRDHENAVEDVFYSCSAKCDENIIGNCLEEQEDIKLANAKKAELKEDLGGFFLASASRDKTIMIWFLISGVPIRTIKGHDTWVRGVNFHPSGRFLISISDDKSIRIWDISKNFRLHKKMADAHESHILCMDWHKAVSSMATGGQENEIKIWQCK